MKSQDLMGGGMNLTCNSFTSAVHIVREVRLKDCTAQIRHMAHDCKYEPQGGTPFLNLLSPFVFILVESYIQTY